MTQTIEPAPISRYTDASLRIAIVVSDYNAHINDKMLAGAITTLRDSGIPDRTIHVARVPGAWELPLVCQQLAANPEYCGVIALGTVIKGETSHDQHINRAVSQALMQISLHHHKPIAFGLLTVNTLEQAIQRSGGNVGNKGDEAASALIASLRLLAAIG